MPSSSTQKRRSGDSEGAEEDGERRGGCGPVSWSTNQPPVLLWANNLLRYSLHDVDGVLYIYDHTSGTRIAKKTVKEEEISVPLAIERSWCSPQSEF